MAKGKPRRENTKINKVKVKERNKLSRAVNSLLCLSFWHRLERCPCSERHQMRSRPRLALALLISCLLPPGLQFPHVLGEAEITALTVENSRLWFLDISCLFIYYTVSWLHFYLSCIWLWKNKTFITIRKVMFMQKSFTEKTFIDPDNF